jgi:hypothetical protein
MSRMQKAEVEQRRKLEEIKNLVESVILMGD